MPYPIFITGATQRLGLAIARDLLSQDTPVIFTYRTPKPSVDELVHKGAIAVKADFSTQAAIDRAILEVKAACDGLRAIIHNASDWAPETTDESDGARIARMMAVHASAPYCINKALASYLSKTEGIADIIHMTDLVQETGSEKHLAYAASKAALHNLTLSFSRALAPEIKVNSIAPSLLMFNEGDDEAYRERASAKFLLPPAPGAHEAVNAVNFVLGSDYMTGQTIHLNGGRPLKNC
ncbi:dihydromonapterin reductase [Alteromonas halophila]|uniref:Dihydromonapterin reductase n=1 Tax=Alteromonas halophila TaxID=516698 RepID=A0A918JJ09_9ALTE|nr:dihydromonapterin reductase [Alteromonas halophila]GGW83397.1 dihydromonapterin reductase [Alteromonas halophila]